MIQREEGPELASLFDFTMGLVDIYTDLENCCVLLQLSIENEEKLIEAVKTTKAVLRKKQTLIEKLATMDIDCRLDTMQVGKKPTS